MRIRLTGSSAQQLLSLISHSLPRIHAYSMEKGTRSSRMNETVMKKSEQDHVFTPLKDQLVDVGEKGVSTGQQSLDLIL